MYIGRNEEGLKHHFTFFLNEKTLIPFKERGHIFELVFRYKIQYTRDLGIEWLRSLDRMLESL